MNEIPDELVPNCISCRIHFEAIAQVAVAAFASVGIEHGRSARDECALYMAAYHRRGHDWEN